MRSSSLQQARALVIKHSIQQRRAIKTNICLISAPLVFCIFLWVMQNAVRGLLLNNQDFQCGCQCLQCCRGPRKRNCSSLDSGYCDTRRGYSCELTNSSNCGVQFSSSRQAVWCPIAYPSSWPPVLRIPQTQFRARPWAPNLAMPYTGSNTTTATSASKAMFPLLSVSPLQLPKAQEMLTGLVDASGSSRFNAHILSQLGFQFANTGLPPNNYYVDSAFIGGPTSNLDTSTSDFIYVILPVGTCKASNLTKPLPITTFIINYYSAQYPTFRPLISQLANISFGSSPEAALLSTINLLCIEAQPVARESFKAINRELYCGWRGARCNGTSTINAVTGAWDWLNTSTPLQGPPLQGLSVIIDYNLSLPASTEPRLYRIPGQLNAAVRGWAGTLPASVAQAISHAVGLHGLMSFPKPTTELPFDLSSLLGPLFYTWVVQLLIPTFLQQLVYEKERRLRMMMRIHGLGDGPYWCITYLWYMILYIVYIFFFMLIGGAIRLEMFVNNSYGVQAILYIIYGNTMIAFCFILSCFFMNSRTAEAFGYLYVLATGLLGALLLSNLMDQDKWFCPLFELVPGFALYRGLYELAAYSLYGRNSQQFGLTFSKLDDQGNGMFVAWAILLAEWPLFMILAFYLEQVLGSGAGAKRHPLFFLQGCGWTPKRASYPEAPDPATAKVQADAFEPPFDEEAGGKPSLPLPTPTSRLPLLPHPPPPEPPFPPFQHPWPILTQSGRLNSTTPMLPPLPPDSPRPPHPPHSPLRRSSSPGLPGPPADVMAALVTPPADARSCGAVGGSGTGTEGRLEMTGVPPPAPLPSPSKPKAPHPEAFSPALYPDVYAEELRVEHIVRGASDERTLGREWPILIRDLKKTFPKFAGGTERHAVRGISLAVGDGECVGLLGPNGAGKTTMLNMLTGFLDPSAGCALLAGLNVAEDRQRVYSLMGVCPQDNLLWESLTAREHLFFFGRLKGLTGQDLNEAVTSALRAVNLLVEVDKKVLAFSGGMKRRLSVAISLIGSPQVVLLDEPSTGLDPASRRGLWDLIKQSKPGRGLILTTHSMEEAETLCDRLGIFVDGKLVCVGNPREITSRYAGYLVFSVTVPLGQEEQAKDLVKSMSPNATHTYGVSGTLKYELPLSDVSLSGVFEAMDKVTREVTVLDWGVANATLEEVFIKLARRVGADTQKFH